MVYMSWIADTGLVRKVIKFKFLTPLLQQNDCKSLDFFQTLKMLLTKESDKKQKNYITPTNKRLG